MSEKFIRGRKSKDFIYQLFPLCLSLVILRWVTWLLWAATEEARALGSGQGHLSTKPQQLPCGACSVGWGSLALAEGAGTTGETVLPLMGSGVGGGLSRSRETHALAPDLPFPGPYVSSSCFRFPPDSPFGRWSQGPSTSWQQHCKTHPRTLELQTKMGLRWSWGVT